MNLESHRRELSVEAPKADRVETPGRAVVSSGALAWSLVSWERHSQWNNIQNSPWIGRCAVWNVRWATSKTAPPNVGCAASFISFCSLSSGKPAMPSSLNPPFAKSLCGFDSSRTGRPVVFWWFERKGQFLQCEILPVPTGGFELRLIEPDGTELAGEVDTRHSGSRSWASR